ncbi:MAG TPA: AraC family transcriptional regulator [Pyrinomonadaceae bacterium]|nr:AraC family transcriptional regulator [Pyrinomonadaceae bacterium]
MGLSATPPEIDFRTLHKSPLVSISDYHCHVHDSGPGSEEAAEFNGITLMRRGTFAKHFGKRQFTADVNQAVFFSKDSVYRISHPAECGDRGTFFQINPRVLNDIVRELDPSIDDHPGKPFSFVTGPCDLAIFKRHRDFVMRLEAAKTEPLEHLWADETALQLIADVLASAFDHHGKPRKVNRAATARDHAEKAEAARTYLASRLGEVVTLNEVARAVHASPFNFARIFQQQTGLPIHRYLTQLRLRASLDRLTDGEPDLTGLALDLGFSSHSHFTDVFRRELGVTPSEVRKTSLKKIGKNLIAR